MQRWIKKIVALAWVLVVKCFKSSDKQFNLLQSCN